MAEFKNAEEFGRAWEEFKQAHTQQIEELKAGKADAVLADKVERINAAVGELSGMKDAADRSEVLSREIDEIKTSMARLRAGGREAATEIDEYREKFVAKMRAAANGGDARLDAELREMQTKAITIGTTTAGGHAVPAPIAAEVLQKVLDISPIVGAVRRTNVSSPLYERLVDTRGAASGWAGETDSRSDTATPTLQQVTFTHGELYAVPKASTWSLNDVFFNVEAWLRDALSEEFEYQLGSAITSGDGTSKPTGILNGTPSAIADDDSLSPARAFGTIQYLPSGKADGFQLDRLGSPAGNPADVFIDVIQATNPRYRRGAVWMANRNTEGEMRKFKDSDGRYFWEPSYQMGTPSAFMGYSVLENEHLADTGTNAFPVLFGDFNAGYELVVIEGMRMIRDEVTSKGHVLFYMAQRFGGKIVNDDAIKAVKCATS